MAKFSSACLGVSLSYLNDQCPISIRQTYEVPQASKHGRVYVVGVDGNVVHKDWPQPHVACRLARRPSSLERPPAPTRTSGIRADRSTLESIKGEHECGRMLDATSLRPPDVSPPRTLHDGQSMSKCRSGIWIPRSYHWCQKL